MREKLLDHEKQRQAYRQHWFKPMLLFFCMLSVCLAAARMASVPIMRITFVLTGLSAVFLFSRWYFTRWYITNMRLIYEEGFFLRKKIIWDLEYIFSTAYSQSFVGSIIDYGDIKIVTHRHGSDTLFRDVADAFGFKMKLQLAKAEARVLRMDLQVTLAFENIIKTSANRPQKDGKIVKYIDFLHAQVQKGQLSVQDYDYMKFKILKMY